jgi:hypothetical protein
MLKVRTSRYLGSQVREYRSCSAMVVAMLGALGDYMKYCESFSHEGESKSFVQRIRNFSFI